MNSTYGTMYYVNDMAASVDFYKKLGFKPTYENPNWTEFSIGGHNLCLHATGEAKDTKNGILIVNQDGIKGLYESMKGDGYNVFGLHEVHPQAWSFHLKDKDGNELSYYGAP